MPETEGRTREPETAWSLVKAALKRLAKDYGRPRKQARRLTTVAVAVAVALAEAKATVRIQSVH